LITAAQSPSTSPTARPRSASPDRDPVKGIVLVGPLPARSRTYSLYRQPRRQRQSDAAKALLKRYQARPLPRCSRRKAAGS
jgi:hypothetical protein